MSFFPYVMLFIAFLLLCGLFSELVGDQYSGLRKWVSAGLYAASAGLTLWIGLVTL